MSLDRQETPPAGRPLSRRHALALGAASAGLVLLRPLASPGDAAAADGTEAFRLAVPAGAFGPGGTTPAISAGRPFDLLGLLDPANHGTVEVRARRAGDEWSPWAPLREGRDHAPDGGGRPQASEPVWTGECDELQLRASRRPRRALRLQMVYVPSGLRAAASAVAGEPAARVSASRPPIVRRAAWGARRVRPRARPEFGQVAMAFVHHTEGLNSYSRSRSASVVLAIAACHMLGPRFLTTAQGNALAMRAQIIH